MNFNPELFRTASLLAFTLAFLGGIVTSLGPCNLATIPLIVGFVGGSHDLSRKRSFGLSLAFAVGLAITFMLLGVFAALVGGLIGAGANWWYYLVAAICFMIGLNMLGVLHFDLPMVFGGLRERIGLEGYPRGAGTRPGFRIGGIAMRYTSAGSHLDLCDGRRRVSLWGNLVIRLRFGTRVTGRVGRDLYRCVERFASSGALVAGD